MIGKSIETAEPNSWEIMNSRPTAIEPPWTKLDPWHV